MEVINSVENIVLIIYVGICFVLCGIFIIPSFWDNKEPTVITVREIDDEVEIELSSGNIYRSDDNGITWYSFPTAEPAYSGKNNWLSKKLKTYNKLEKWSAKQLIM